MKPISLSPEKMKSEIVRVYHEFRKADTGGIVGQNAVQAYKSAQILYHFTELEHMGLARLTLHDEDTNYFDVYGEPDDPKIKKEIIHQIENYGLFYITAETRDSNTGTESDWYVQDSIGMCCYPDPLDPFQNPYINDLMHSCLGVEWGGDKD